MNNTLVIHSVQKLFDNRLWFNSNTFAVCGDRYTCMDGSFPFCAVACDGNYECADMSDELDPMCMSTCGGILTDPTGSFSSPGYPNEYPTYSLCLWVIDIPEEDGQDLVNIQSEFEKFQPKNYYKQFQSI